MSERQGGAGEGAGGPPETVEDAAGPLARAYSWIVAGPLCYLIPLLWIAAAVAATMYLPSVSSSAGSLQELTPSNAPAIRAEEQAARLFAIPILSRTAIVQRAPNGLPLAVQRRTVAAAVAVDRHRARPPAGVLGALPIVNIPGLTSSSREVGTTAITFLFFSPTTSWGTQRASAREYAQTYLDAPGDSVVGVTGAIPARLAQGDEILRRLSLVEAATIAMVALIVGLTFRSIGGPLVTLFAGLVAYTVAMRVTAWVGIHTGIAAPAELQPLMIVLLLGIVTDYSVFYLTGFRFRLAAGRQRGAAARATTAEFTPIILTAGLMIAAGAIGLLVATLTFFRALGPGLALTIVVGLAVAVTLVPALLAVFGRLLYWPRVPTPPGSAEGRAMAPAAPNGETAPQRPARLSTTKGVATLIAVLCIAVLVAASTGLRHVRLGFDLISALPGSSEVKRAASAAEQGFSAGILSPTEVILRQPGIGRRTGSLAALEGAIRRQPGVAQVIGPREQTVLTKIGLAPIPPIAVSRNGDAARYLVVFNADPLGSHGIVRYDSLRRAMPSLLSATHLSGARVSYAGDTALAQETVSSTMHDLVRIAIAVLVIDLVLLMLFLRALIAPLYLLAASVLALGASVGVIAYVFIVLLHAEDLTYYVPFAAAVLLVSLGSDYNVFLVGRIWEEARIRPLRRAIESAVPRARRAISVAALALALGFALLALIDLSSFRELAFLLAFGVLVDSFFVRSLLVPALVALFGRTTAWPEPASPASCRTELRHRAARAGPQGGMTRSLRTVEKALSLWAGEVAATDVAAVVAQRHLR